MVLNQQSKAVVISMLNKQLSATTNSIEIAKIKLAISQLELS